MTLERIFRLLRHIDEGHDDGIDTGRRFCEEPNREPPLPVMVMHSTNDTVFPGYGAEAERWWTTANDQPLAEKHHDHALSGDWKDHHIKPDVVLIYRKPDDTGLQLVPLGSHSELGL